IEQQAKDLTVSIEASDQKATVAKEEAGLAKSATEALDLITKETAGKMVDVEQMAADAKTNASNALADAQTALDRSNTAIGDASAAKGSASDAVTKANEAKNAANVLS